MVKYKIIVKSKKYKSGKCKKSKKSKKNIKQVGGGYLNIQYGNIIINDTKTQLLTKLQTNQQPQILVTYPNKSLLVMLDPDAPIGTFVHLVQVYNNNQLQTTQVNYYPPTPPSGIHRYITTLYDLPKDIIIPQGQAGNEYYKNIETILKKLKMITSKQFQVTA
jgi:phosphatidylethanolamine-binding protein (PEBP) family uncharacterized protein